jgi:UDP-galactopyranose mutase
MLKKYDYLIVGAGFYGAVSAYELKKKGYKCLVIEKRNHIGGNCYTETVEGINVHKYGAHIFHTNDREIWEYVNQLVEFNRYTNSPVAINNGKLYNLPFNMNTFYQIWGVRTPKEAVDKIAEQTEKYKDVNPQNLEEQALKLVGDDIYNILIKEYTEKQWGMKATELPAFIIKRLPIRFTFDNNYFNDTYQGVPIGGYTKIFEKLLEETEVLLNTDFFANRGYFEALAEKIIYTGPIDKFFNYEAGKLNYRSLRFENESLDIENFQGNAVVNYTSHEETFTRIIEHKHFEFGTQKKTVITKEYPQDWNENLEPYYPVNDSVNNKIYSEYKKKADALEKVIFGGRLAEYKYYDMHQIVGSALSKMKKILNNEKEKL